MAKRFYSRFLIDSYTCDKVKWFKRYWSCKNYFIIVLPINLDNNSAKGLLPRESGDYYYYNYNYYYYYAVLLLL